MKRLLENFFFCLLILAPVQSFAKAETAKITIAVADLRNPIDITDPKILSHFRVWDGLGPALSRPIHSSIDWSKGPAAEPPSRFKRYQVSFFRKASASAASLRSCSMSTTRRLTRATCTFPAKLMNGTAQRKHDFFVATKGNWYHSSKAWDETAWPSDLRNCD